MSEPGVGAEQALDPTLPENGGIAPAEPRPWTGFHGVEGQRGLIDDFNRADGPLGADWTDQTGTFQIVSQMATGGSPAMTTHNTATGDTVEMDVARNGTSLQYVAAVLNYGGGATNLFVKVQVSSGGGINYGACYIGNNGGGGTFGLGYFALTQEFDTAHMAVTVDGSRTVTIDLTDVNGGSLPDQQYVCTGAPAAEGPAIGMGGYAAIGRIDNFADGPIPVELMRFTVE